MNNHMKRVNIASSLLSTRKKFPSHLKHLLYLFIWATVFAALIAGLLLLVSDIFVPMFPHAPLSAAPLLLIGATYLGFQMLMRPKPLDLFKASIISSAFLLWGIDQLLHPGRFATTLGDVVIVLYVIDLSWIMTDRLKLQWKSRHAKSVKSEAKSSLSSPEWSESMPPLHLGP